MLGVLKNDNENKNDNKNMFEIYVDGSYYTNKKILELKKLIPKKFKLNIIINMVKDIVCS